MKIVVVGDGKVGFALTQQLSQEGHDLTVIERDAAVLERTMEQLDVMGVSGNGASLEVQRSAGVMNNDLLIAVTSADEINLLCCILARKLGCPQTIARVRNPEYAQQVRFLQKELGLSMTINPERATAHAVFRVLQFPSFLKLDAFASGRVELVELRVRKGEKLDGIPLKELYEIAKVRVLVCSVDRGGEIVIPGGNFTLRADDTIAVTAATKDLAQLIKNLGISTQKIHNVMIIGGSRIALYLAQELIDSRINVKIIERDAARCRMLSESLPKAIVIHGDGGQQNLLEMESIQSMDAVVTLTGVDEENLVISMYADYVGVPKTVTKINRMELSAVFKDRGAGSLISPKQLTASEIARYVRALGNKTGGSMITLHGIMGGKAEAMEFLADKGTLYLSTPLSKLNLKPNLLITCINRSGRIIIPRGSDTIEAGDTVVVVAAAGDVLGELNDIFVQV